MGPLTLNWKRHSDLAFASLAGAVAVAGFAPVGWFLLPILSLAWLIHGWNRADSRGRAAALGAAWGLGFFLTGVSWVYVSLHDMGDMAAPLAGAATLLFCSYLALFPALAGWAFACLRTRQPVADALLACAVWVLGELARGWLFTGFPWLSLGYSQTPPSPLAGYAPVIGNYGISLILAAGAALIALRFRAISSWAAILVLVAVGAFLRPVAWSTPVGNSVKVSLLQGNIPQSLKWDPRRLELSVSTYLQLARAHPAALTVLPETAIPLFLGEIPPQILTALKGHGELLLGAAVMQSDGTYFNGAVAVNAKGSTGTYFKHHLVPFGEFVPQGFAWFFHLVKIPLSGFSQGAAQQEPLELGGQKLMPNICYEDLFGEEIIAGLPAATLLVNLSNTAWFGHSLAQPQHLQIARMRALEVARPMLRATNTGMTAAILPDGSVTAMLPPFTSDALEVEVRGYQGTTPYARFTNWPTILLALLALLPALAKRRTGRR